MHRLTGGGQASIRLMIAARQSGQQALPPREQGLLRLAGDMATSW